jgi:hypothetical protein
MSQAKNNTNPEDRANERIEDLLLEALLNVRRMRDYILIHQNLYPDEMQPFDLEMQYTGIEQCLKMAAKRINPRTNLEPPGLENLRKRD